MNSSGSCATMEYACAVESTSSSDHEDLIDCVPDMASSVREVEKVLDYKFKSVELLEEALTHPSYIDSASYDRLEFVGDAALGLAFANYAFLTYPNLDQGQLTLLRAANVSTEKLARAAVKHGLYRYIRHNAAALHENVRDFVVAVKQEGEIEVYGGAVKAPKILADIVESVAAAVYVDCGFDLKASWPIFERLLEPFITLDLLQKQPQPVTMLFELCQRKGGKQPDISYSTKGENIIANVFVDGQLIGSASSKQRENAKLHAAKAALQELSYNNDYKISTDYFSEINESSEIEGAKHKLQEICGKKKWPKPSYKTEKETGPAHGRRFICSVRIETATAELFTTGEEKSRRKDAENSAATIMLLGLQESKYV